MKKTKTLLIYIMFFCFPLIICDDRKCGFIIKNILFVLDNLNQEKDYTYKTSNNQTLQFSFCNYTQSFCNNQQSYANLYEKYPYTPNSSCIRLTGNESFYSYGYTLIDDNNPNKGLSILLSGGEKYSQSNLYYSINYEMICSKATQNITILGFEQIDNVYKLRINSKYACPYLQFSAIWDFILNYRWIFIIITLTIGIIECFFGRRLLNITFFLAGYGTGGSIALTFLCYYMVWIQTDFFIIWIILCNSCVIGIISGVFILSTKKLGLFLLGIWLGIAIGVLLYNAFLYMWEFQTIQLVLYLTLVVGAICFGLSVIFFCEHIIILSTSLCGSYGIIRALSFLIGGFSNEFEINTQQEYRFYSRGLEFYIYLLAILILALLGGYVQYKHRKAVKLSDIDIYARL